MVVVSEGIVRMQGSTVLDGREHVGGPLGMSEQQQSEEGYGKNQ